ncbi:MAG: hypothetical protein ACT4RN_09130 [Pseudonocardia sp.]
MEGREVVVSKTSTGDPTAYTEDDESGLIDAVDEGWEEFEHPTKMTVSAVVEWSGSTNRAHGGHRTVRLDGLELGGVKAALDDARAAGNAARGARTATSYTAQSWHAQISALTKHSRGSELADRAGLDPTARTLSAWLSESRAPSKANRARIAEAYEGLRTANIESARARQRQANHRAAESISDAVRDRYGAEVRFTDVRSVEFDD